MASREELISQLAFERGLLTPVQLSEALSAKRAGGSEGILGVLVAKGHLTREQVDELSREADGGSAAAEAVAVEQAPPATIEPPAAPGGRIEDMRLVGGYEVVEKIGRGAMGSVYRARKLDTGDIVALKVLPPSAATRQLIARFKRESEIVKRLDHPNIVKCHDFGYDEKKDCHFCALELVEGENLRDMIARLGTLPEQEVITIARQLANALNHAFGSGLVHRDVKPANVMVTRGGVVKLLDLGLARPVEVDGPGVTMAGTFVGSPYYASPEQAKADSSIDFRADIYSLGATIYHMVAGHPPFEGSNVTEVLIKQLDGQIPWPEGRDAEFARRLGLVAAKMMAKDPADRYQTPTEMSLDLDIIGQGTDPVIASKGTVLSTIALPGWPTVGKAKRPRRPAQAEAHAERKRRPTTRHEAVRAASPEGERGGLTGAQWGLVVAGVLVLGLVGVMAFVFSRGPNDEPPPAPVAAPGSGTVAPVSASPDAGAPKRDRERVARETFAAAKRHADEHPEDFAGASAKYREAVAAGKGTAVELEADAALVALDERWKAVAGEALAAAKEKVAALVDKDDYDGAIAEFEGIPKGLASKVVQAIVAETTAVHQAAGAKIDAALAKADALLAGGDAAGARAAVKSIEAVEFKQGQDAVAPRVMALLMKAEEADRLAALAKADRANEKLAALLAEFEGLLRKVQYARAAERMTAAAREPGYATMADCLRAAARVAGELGERRAAMIASAEARVGRPISLETDKGVRRGTLKEASDRSIVVVSQIIINGKVQGENRYEVAWADLPAGMADEFASDWAPAGADGDVAKAFLAIWRDDTDAAAAALAAAGEHPLSKYLAAKLAPATPEAASAPAAGGTRAAWPPTREQVAACFRCGVKGYDPATLTVTLLYSFENPEEIRDWKLAEWGRKPDDRVVIHDGRLYVRGARVWALAPGVFTRVAVKADFALHREDSTDAALAVFADGKGNAYNFFGIQGGKLTFVEKWVDTKFEWLSDKAPSPLAGRRRGQIGFSCGGGKLIGWLGGGIAASVKDASLTSGGVGVFTRESTASFDNITIKGVLDKDWLRGQVAPARVAARPAGVPPDAVEFGGHFYKLYEQTVPWHEAKRHSEEMGGHLITISSAEEQRFAAEIAKRSEARGIWIGLTEEGHPDDWRWVTGEPFTFKGWSKGEPNNWQGAAENWAALFSAYDHRWVDVASRLPTIGFICEWEPAAAKAAPTGGARAPAAAPAAAPSSASAGSVKKTGLLGTYFNGTDLETPAMRRVDASLVLNFGTQSPFPGKVAADFSVRWEGSITPPKTGDYVFQITSDDGARLWIGGRSLIDKWAAAIIQARSEPIPLVQGKSYPLKLEYRDVMHNAHIRLAWSGPGFEDQPVPEKCLAPPKGYERIPGPPIYGLMLAAKVAEGAKPAPRIVKTHGLMGYYYLGTSFDKLVARQLAARPDFSKTGLAWPGEVRKKKSSARWEGFIAPPKTGEYLFSATSDDGCRMSIAGVSVLDKWSPGEKPVEAMEPVRLERGKMYPLRVEFFDVGGEAYITVFCSGPGFEKQVIPSEWLIPAEPKGGALPPSASEKTAGDWTVQKWGNPARLGLTKPRGADVLTVEVPAGGKEDKAAAGTSKPPSLAGKRVLQLTARNSGKSSVSIALGFITSGGYFETKPAALAPGKAARVAIDLGARDFKCKATKWLYESPLAGAAQTSQMFLLVYSGGQEAKVLFADLRAE